MGSPDDLWLHGYGPDSSGAWNIFRLRRDGAERVRVNTNQSIEYFNLTESPDGGTYLYSGGRRIMFLEGIGTDPTPVTPAEFEAFMPRFSPDGERLVFDGNDGSGWDLYSIRTNGSNLRRLTRSPGIESNASWSPDASRLVHMCQIADTTTLCMLDLERLTSTALFLP